MSLIFHDCSSPSGRSILLKFSQIVAKRSKQEVTKFGSHTLNGFRVAANTKVCSLLEWSFIISIDTSWDWFQRTYVLITARKNL